MALARIAIVILRIGVAPLTSYKQIERSREVEATMWCSTVLNLTLVNVSLPHLYVWMGAVRNGSHRSMALPDVINWFKLRWWSIHVRAYGLRYVDVGVCASGPPSSNPRFMVHSLTVASAEHENMFAVSSWPSTGLITSPRTKPLCAWGIDQRHFFDERLHTLISVLFQRWKTISNKKMEPLVWRKRGEWHEPPSVAPDANVLKLFGCFAIQYTESPWPSKAAINGFANALSNLVAF